MGISLHVTEWLLTWHPRYESDL